MVKNSDRGEEDGNQTAPDVQEENIDSIDDKFKFSIKVRTSSGKEEKLKVHDSETILHIKRRLAEIIGVEQHQQRWFFYGHELKDTMTVEDSKLVNGYVVQVHINSA